jgi:hypothetical protein
MPLPGQVAVERAELAQQVAQPLQLAGGDAPSSAPRARPLAASSATMPRRFACTCRCGRGAPPKAVSSCTSAARVVVDEGSSSIPNSRQ